MDTSNVLMLYPLPRISHQQLSSFPMIMIIAAAHGSDISGAGERRLCTSGNIMINVHMVSGAGGAGGGLGHNNIQLQTL